MSDCLIVGDSIAKGVSDIRKDCVAYVQSGINSREWNRKFINRPMGGRVVVISLGSNDTPMVNSREELQYLRRMVDSADRVLWILPAIKPQIRNIIMQLASDWGDDVLELLKLSPDGVHPTMSGYKAIAKQF